jgi:hypothetical protein
MLRPPDAGGRRTTTEQDLTVPDKSVFERMGDRFAAWMPEWFTDTMALSVIVVCLIIFLV